MDIKNKTISNMLCRFAERSAAQVVSFIVSIVLPRLISPKEYGSITLIMVFTSILQVFVDSGMGNALIQKKDSDDLDFSSVFYFNFIIFCIYEFFYIFFKIYIDISGVMSYYNHNKRKGGRTTKNIILFPII